MEHWKLIHSGDFRLGEPLLTSWHIDDALDERLVEAPYHAVQRLTDLACEQQPHAVLLAGNLLDPRASGAYAVAFLHEQFRRLHEAQVPVFWALGATDRLAYWNHAPQWPENVVIFDTTRWSRHRLSVAEHRLEIVGRSWGGGTLHQERNWPARSSADTPMLVVAALDHREVPSSAHGCYWALGGKESPCDLNSEQPVMRYCGCPQTRSADATTAGSATWLEVTPGGDVQCEAIPLGSVARVRRRLSAAQDDIPSRSDVAAAIVEDVQRFLRDELTVEACAAADAECHLLSYQLTDAPPEMVSRYSDPVQRQECVRAVNQALGSDTCYVTDVVCTRMQQRVIHEDGTVLSDFLAELASNERDWAQLVTREAAPQWCDSCWIPAGEELRRNAEDWALAALSGRAMGRAG